MILLKFVIYGIVSIATCIINYIYNTHIYKKYILHIPQNVEHSKQIITKYSDWNVTGIYICKQPINSILDKCINFISLNTFDILCKALNYNNIYHISLIFILKNENTYKIVLVDKQHIIRLSDNFNINNTTMELCSIQLETPNLLFGNMINKTYDINKEEYNTYEILTNNCQTFAYNFLKANNLLTDVYEKFILQDLKSIQNDIPKYSHKFINGVVYIYSLIESKIDYYWNMLFNTSILEDLKKIDDENGETDQQNAISDS